MSHNLHGNSVEVWHYPLQRGSEANTDQVTYFHYVYSGQVLADPGWKLQPCTSHPGWQHLSMVLVSSTHRCEWPTCSVLAHKSEPRIMALTGIHPLLSDSVEGDLVWAYLKAQNMAMVALLWVQWVGEGNAVTSPTPLGGCWDEFQCSENKAHFSFWLVSISFLKPKSPRNTLSQGTGSVNQSSNEI